MTGDSPQPSTNQDMKMKRNSKYTYDSLEFWSGKYKTSNLGIRQQQHPFFILLSSSFRTVGKIPMDNKSCFYSPLLLPNFCYKSQTFKSFHQFHKLNQHEQQGFSLPCHLCPSVRCFVFQTTKTTCKFLL